MGLFGGGNSSSSTSTTTNNLENTVTPQSDLSGSTAGVNVQTSPTALQGSVGAITTNASSFFAPVYNTPSFNEGDSAIDAAQQTAQAQISAQSAAQQAGATSASSSPSWFTNLFQAPDIYYLIAGLVLLMIFRGHHR